MVTVKKIAQVCNVSPSTVSNILNGKSNVGEETRQRVLDFVKESGYQPNYFAQSMRKQNKRIISIITEDLNEFSTSPIVEEIMAYCDDNDYRTILMNMRLYDKWQDTWYNDCEKLNSVLKPIMQEALSIRVDGVIYVAGHCRVIDCFPADFSIPTVIAYGISKDRKYPSVIIDDETGGYDMTKYLISRGHRKIGVIAGVADNHHTKCRLLGYQKAMFEAGIPYNPAWVCYGDWQRNSGYLAAGTLLKEDITAVFCMSDAMAGGVYDYAYEQKIEIGKDLSVVGYDNRIFANYLNPRLTTNEIQLRGIGKVAAEIMLKGLESETVEENGNDVIKVPCKVMERLSVNTIDRKGVMKNEQN